MDHKLFDSWMETRPESIKKLAKEFPLHTPVIVHDKTWYVIGWNEDDMLLVAPITLEDDYDRAMAKKQRVCASHYR